MSLIWVIGSGGLLGTALHNKIAQTTDTLFNPEIQFNWSNRDLITKEIESAVDRFSSQARQGNWKIYWAAGMGTMHSSTEDLEEEIYTLKFLVTCLINNQKLTLKRGAFIFSSSAGAIYAGNQNEIINESTHPAPINPYGISKLEQEKVISSLYSRGFGATIILCRITTIYGVKRANGKPQGLLAELIRRALTNKPTHIYVPLETMRDYIHAEIAANKIIEFAKSKENFAGIYIKIIASGVSSSIAQILTIIKAICKRNIRVVTQPDSKNNQYQRISQFKSQYEQSDRSNNYENLIEGIALLVKEIKIDIAKGKFTNK